MKKSYVILWSVLTLALTGCQQDPEVNSLVGNYTYKASGVVTLQQSDTIFSDVHLTPETGTMTLTTTGKDKEVVLSFNQNSGDAYDITAIVTADSLYVRSFHRNIDVEVPQDTLLTGDVIMRREIYDVEVKGAGHQLSNGEVCLMLSYSGVQRNDPDCLLHGQNIHVHCKPNAK